VAKGFVSAHSAGGNAEWLTLGGASVDYESQDPNAIHLADTFMKTPLSSGLIDAKWKMPPSEKVYEALSAVADGRVTLTGPTSAEVGSSSGDKKYLVEWSADGSEISSNDNASYWQGYIGYPIIAVLLVTGRISYDQAAGEALRGLEWKKLNKQHKNDYAKAVKAVLDDLEARGTPAQPIVEAANAIFGKLVELPLKKMLSRRRRPPRRLSSLVNDSR